MKKMLNIFIMLVVVLSGLPSPAFARSTDVPAAMGDFLVDVAESPAAVTFASLGYKDVNLVSPYDSTRFYFSLPQNWQLTEGGVIDLSFDVVVTGSGATDTTNLYGGQLIVVFNGQTIGTIQLDHIGSQSVQLPIPTTALKSTREDGRNQLTVSLNAQFSCTYDTRTLVTIKALSTFNLAFNVSTPELNLAKLPAPFFMRGSLLPDRTLVVLPDNPSVGELQSALDIMSGFGSMVGSEFNILMTSIGQLTNDDVTSSNLIFVGKPAGLAKISDVEFRIRIVNGQFVSLPQESENDGVIQMAHSPWNSSKVVMLVSGNTDDAVLKAGQAVSSGPVFIYNDPALAYVSTVQLTTDTLPLIEDFTLANLGYSDETISGIGLNSADYDFKVSREQLGTQDGTINLVYYHSGLLDYANSSFSVEINGQAVASNALSKDSEQITNLEIKIPPGSLRFGVNRLTVSTRMVADLSCDTTGFSDPWFIVSDQTALHIPASTTVIKTLSLLDLKYYPGLFTTHSELGDLAFVLPKSSPQSWTLAGKIAYNLGSNSNPAISNLKVAYADNVPQDIKTSNSLLFIGQANALPLLSEVNDKLPAPFDFTTNTASEKQMQVVYRIPSGVSVGYLELAPSPYNAEKAILVVAGNTPDGLNMAGDTLVKPILRGKLGGLFAISNGSQVAISQADSLFSIVGSIVPGAVQVVATPLPSPATKTTVMTRPGWLLPLLVISGLIVLVILGLVVHAAMQNSSQTYSATQEDESNQSTK